MAVGGSSVCQGPRGCLRGSRVPAISASCPPAVSPPLTPAKSLATRCRLANPHAAPLHPFLPLRVHRVQLAASTPAARWGLLQARAARTRQWPRSLAAPAPPAAAAPVQPACVAATTPPTRAHGLREPAASGSRPWRSRNASPSAASPDNTTVRPWGAASTTCVTPRSPPAPGMFSTFTGAPSSEVGEAGTGNSRMRDRDGDPGSVKLHTNRTYQPKRLSSYTSLPMTREQLG